MLSAARSALQLNNQLAEPAVSHSTPPSPPPSSTDPMLWQQQHAAPERTSTLPLSSAHCSSLSTSLHTCAGAQAQHMTWQQHMRCHGMLAQQVLCL